MASNIRNINNNNTNKMEKAPTITSESDTRNGDNDELVSPCRDSLLTTTSGYTNYRGLLNLIIILLFLSNARAALENIIKYGILVDPFQWLSFLIEGSKHWPSLVILAECASHCLISFVIERLIAYRWFCLQERSSLKKVNIDTRDQSIIVLANATLIANLLACLVIPPVVVFSCQTHPISASISLIMVSIVLLKLVSYHMMNYWCRDLRRPPELRSRTTQSFLRNYVPPRIEFGKYKQLQEQQQLQKQQQQLQRNTQTNNQSSPSPKVIIPKDEIKQAAMDVLSKYPNNLKLDQFFWYMVYPTLSYELEYARTDRIRKRFLVKRIVEVIVLSQLDMALIQQWIVPTVNNSLIPFRQMQFSHMLERLLKLAIPNHVIWMIWFYTFFHSLLNIQAELTRYADREFYRDWWNSESVHYFWSHWNIPVHKWCARHLYLPLMSIGFNKCHAGTAVFFVSAFFHEYLVSVPLKIFRIWAFMGMLIQLPWARFVSAYFNNNSANVAVWVSIILGQPLCILMYYHDYYVMNHSTTVSAAAEAVSGATTTTASVISEAARVVYASTIEPALINAN